MSSLPRKPKLKHQFNVRLDDELLSGLVQLKNLEVDTAEWLRGLISVGLKTAIPQALKERPAN